MLMLKTVIFESHNSEST